MSLLGRARRHAALGDQRRLQIVDALIVGDRTVAELADLSGLRGNLLAHHLSVLEEAALIERRTSEGDRRRRYVTLAANPISGEELDPILSVDDVVFVCTKNSARSQFAAALWAETTGSAARSAGSQPAQTVHPKAIQVAIEFGVDLSGATPRGYADLPSDIELVVSVCDRANETGLPESTKHLHWSVPDPVAVGKLESFRGAFGDIERRVARLTEVVA